MNVLKQDAENAIQWFTNNFIQTNPEVKSIHVHEKDNMFRNVPEHMENNCRNIKCKYIKGIASNRGQTQIQ